MKRNILSVELTDELITKLDSYVNYMNSAVVNRKSKLTRSDIIRDAIDYYGTQVDFLRGMEEEYRNHLDRMAGNSAACEEG